MYSRLIKSLTMKAAVCCLVVAVAPAALVGWLMYANARGALESAQLEKLAEARDRADESIIDYLVDGITHLTVLAQTSSVQEAFEVFSFYGSAGSDSSALKLEVGSDKYQRIVAAIDPLFKKWMKFYESSRAYRDLMAIVGPGKGRIIYTVKRYKDLVADPAEKDRKENKLAALYEKVVQTKRPSIADFSPYGDVGDPSAFLAVPVFKNGRELLGVLALRIGPERIESIVRSLGALGDTGAGFVVGADHLARADCAAGTAAVLRRKFNSRAALEAVQGRKGIGESTTADGKPVLEAWSGVGLPDAVGLNADFDWGIVAMIDADEAFAVVTAQGRLLAVLVPVIGFLAAAAAFMLTRTVTGPIGVIAFAAKQIRAGNLGVRLPAAKRTDEIGELHEAFRLMAARLRDEISRTKAGIAVLSVAAAEISQTITQLAIVSSNTSGAVTETTATVEEIRQAAQLAGQRASEVAQTSHRAVETSETGARATEETVARMGLILEQMKSIGHTTARLSEHGQTVEEIIFTIQDLADQSDILAVNASIESARAGDYGKGFAVVATEIKLLAEQSKASTERIRRLLEDTRKWIAAVVRAGEEANQAVDLGVEQSMLAGESIRLLAETVSTAAQSATVIQATSEQQEVGMDAVFEAMAGVEGSARQNLEGIVQLEKQAKRLSQLGAQLKDAVEAYNLEEGE